MKDIRYSNLSGKQAQGNLEHPQLANRGVSDRDALQTTNTGVFQKFNSMPRVLSIWWLEIISLVIMLVAFAAMIITDLKYHNKPIPSWPRDMSINLLHAFYGAFLKDSMIISISAGLSQLKWSWYKRSRPLRDIEYWDKASRGPWGSLLLIARLRGRHIVATIGAMTVVLALALDLFVQFLLFYDACWVYPANQQALIPVRNDYRDYAENGLGPHDFGSQSIVPDLGKAVAAGFLGAPIASIQPTCGTSNCTFNEPYHSVAFCADCLDISEHLIVKFNPPDGNPGSLPWTTYSVPVNTNITITISRIQDLYLQAALYAAVPEQTWIIIVATNLTRPIVSQVDSNQNCAIPKPENVWSCRGYGAANCTIKPCVRTYNAIIENSRLNESTLGEFKSLLATEYIDSDWAAVSIKCLPSIAYGQLLGRLYPLNNSTEWIGYKGEDFYYNTTFQSRRKDYKQLANMSLSIPAKCVYSMSGRISWLAQEYIRNITTGNITMRNALQQAGPLIPRYLFNNGNTSFTWINHSFSQAALAMTNYIRQAQYTEHLNGSTHFREPAKGVARQIQTCMYVRWSYLAYPATLVVMTLVFFAAMVHETWSHDSDCDWKDSSLALVFHGILNNTQNAEALENVSVNTKDEMNQVAEKLYVRFTTEEEEQR